MAQKNQLRENQITCRHFENLKLKMCHVCSEKDLKNHHYGCSYNNMHLKISGYTLILKELNTEKNLHKQK